MNSEVKVVLVLAQTEQKQRQEKATVVFSCGAMKGILSH